MRYSVQSKNRKYVEGFVFLSFSRKFGSKYGKKLVNTGISSAKNLAIVNMVKKFKTQQKRRD